MNLLSIFCNMPHPTRLVRITLAGSVLLALISGTGCESVKTVSTPHSTVSPYTGLNAAMAVNRSQGRVTGRGMGQSMAPLYGDNSIVVTNPIEWEALQPGMVVVYRNNQGRNVAHKLSHREGQNWVTGGINNQHADTDRVTPQNLIGVVYATFHTQQ